MAAGREKRSVDFNHGPSGEQSELSPEIEPNLRDPTVAGTSVGFPRTVTVEFQEPEGITRRTGRRPSFRPGVPETGRPSLSPDEERRPQRLGQPLTVTRSLPRTTTMHTNRSAAHTNVTRESGGTALRRVRTGEDVGFGGFPMPHEIIGKIVNYAIPKISDKLHRTISVPARTISLSSQNGDTGAPDGVDLRTRTKSVPYISFDAIIGRNSQFYDLREEELEELGGVEYRALSILLWLVPLVSILELINHTNAHSVSPVLHWRTTDCLHCYCAIRSPTSLETGLFDTNAAIGHDMVRYSVSYTAIHF